MTGDYVPVTVARWCGIRLAAKWCRPEPEEPNLVTATVVHVHQHVHIHEPVPIGIAEDGRVIQAVPQQRAVTTGISEGETGMSRSTDNDPGYDWTPQLPDWDDLPEDPDFPDDE